MEDGVESNNTGDDFSTANEGSGIDSLIKAFSSSPSLPVQVNDVASRSSAASAKKSRSKLIPTNRRRGLLMIRKCGSCNKPFSPLGFKANGGFQGSDNYCSKRCSKRPVQSTFATKSVPVVIDKYTADAAYKRIVRQVGALGASGVPAIFAAEVDSSCGSSKRVIVSATNKDTAIIMQCLLSGSAAGTTWFAPLNTLLAEEMKNGQIEQFEDAFGRFVRGECTKASFTY